MASQSAQAERRSRERSAGQLFKESLARCGTSTVRLLAWALKASSNQLRYKSSAEASGESNLASHEGPRVHGMGSLKASLNASQLQLQHARWLHELALGCVK